MCRAGWRYQIGPWVRAGYRVVAPDMLGYGQSDKPYDPEEYSLKRISGDLASILDVIRVRKAVSPGRMRSGRPGMITDFIDCYRARLGVAYRSEVCPVVPGEGPRSSTVRGLFSGRIVGLTLPCSVSLGYFPPSSNYKQLEAFVKKFPTYEYQLYFASTACSGELERNVRTTPISETDDCALFTQVDPADHEFLQICVSYERLFWS